jgi:hypothetical protein
MYMTLQNVAFKEVVHLLRVNQEDVKVKAYDGLGCHAIFKQFKMASTKAEDHSALQIITERQDRVCDINLQTIHNGKIVSCDFINK